MSGFNTVYDGVEEFNEIMKKVVDLVEEAQSRIQTIDNVGFGEASAKVNSIKDLCESAKKKLDEATDTAEGVLKLLGHR
jgi:methyl-accepting chemotaxis protein